jgi:hypothetical protein
MGEKERGFQSSTVTQRGDLAGDEELLTGVEQLGDSGHYTTN